MNTVHIYISEALDNRHVQELRHDLLDTPWVNDVEISAQSPHDMLVEYQQEHITPMAILRKLNRYGVHTDVTAC